MTGTYDDGEDYAADDDAELRYNVPRTVMHALIAAALKTHDGDVRVSACRRLLPELHDAHARIEWT